ncbi:hypothetical protein DERF_009684 [Dermatophagoides farinae]|uniref:Uncharacterized protein n=1 Tax=Dermatophagoides farinae TaxID=6954 RepID=A0A922HXF4_DERFA|nr:hypothetical protein DERF_009684 [Dermatophagoides farinae]
MISTAIFIIIEMKFIIAIISSTITKRFDQPQHQQSNNDPDRLMKMLMDHKQEIDTQYDYKSNQNLYKPIASRWSNHDDGITSDQIGSINFVPNQNVYSLFMPDITTPIMSSSSSSSAIHHDEDILQMSGTNEKSKVSSSSMRMTTGNHYVPSSPTSSSSSSYHSQQYSKQSKQKQKQQQQQQQQQSPLGIILGHPMTNGFDGHLYIPIYYMNNPTIYPTSHSSAAFESFVGQTFTLPNTASSSTPKTNIMDHRHDPSSMSFVLQQLDQTLMQQQQQQQMNVENNSKSSSKKGLNNLWKALGKLTSNLSPSSSENTRSSKAMIADGSEQIQPYHPYPLKHIGGPYYVGPPILGIHDPDVELKFAMETSNNHLDRSGKNLATNEFMGDFLMNAAHHNVMVNDDHDDDNPYYYGIQHDENEPIMIVDQNHHHHHHYQSAPVPTTTSTITTTESINKSNQTVNNSISNQNSMRKNPLKTTTIKPNYNYHKESTINPTIVSTESPSSWKAIISTTTTTTPKPLITSTTTKTIINIDSSLSNHHHYTTIMDKNNASSNIFGPQSEWIPTSAAAAAARKQNSLKTSNVFKFPISF